MEGEKAVIDMDKCIKCGKCHDICPQEALRHDSEKITYEIEGNLAKIEKNMAQFKSKSSKRAFLGRMKNILKNK